MDESQEQLEGVHAKLRDDSSFQFDLPEAPPPPPDIDFSWLNGFFQFLAQIIKVLGPIVFWLFVAAPLGFGSTCSPFVAGFVALASLTSVFACTCDLYGSRVLCK